MSHYTWCQGSVNSNFDFGNVTLVKANAPSVCLLSFPARFLLMWLFWVSFAFPWKVPRLDGREELLKKPLIWGSELRLYWATKNSLQRSLGRFLFVAPSCCSRSLDWKQSRCLWRARECCWKSSWSLIAVQLVTTCPSCFCLWPCALGPVLAWHGNCLRLDSVCLSTLL